MRLPYEWPLPGLVANWQSRPQGVVPGAQLRRRSPASEENGWLPTRHLPSYPFDLRQQRVWMAQSLGEQCASPAMITKPYALENAAVLDD